VVDRVASRATIAAAAMRGVLFGEKRIERGGRFAIDGVPRYRLRFENVVRRVFAEARENFLLQGFRRGIELQIPGGRRQPRLKCAIFGE